MEVGVGTNAFGEVAHPRGAHLGQVRSRAAGDRGLVLVVRRVPRQRGDVDLHPGVRGLELLRERGQRGPSSACAHTVRVPLAGPDAMVLAALGADAVSLLLPQEVRTIAAAIPTARAAAAGIAFIRNMDTSPIRRRTALVIPRAGLAGHFHWAVYWTVGAGAYRSHQADGGTSACAVRHPADDAVLRGSGQLRRHR